VFGGWLCDWMASEEIVQGTAKTAASDCCCICSGSKPMETEGVAVLVVVTFDAVLQQIQRLMQLTMPKQV